MPQPLAKLYVCSLLIVPVLVGCGGSGSSASPPPVAPVFSSVPVTAAAEGTPYTYQLAATAADQSAITFALTSAPTGAALSGNTVSWTPTHDQSRAANPFAVTATTSQGGTATQTWSVTPNGTIQIKAVFTYWTPTGPINVPRVWLAEQPYPSALIPQTDGSYLRLQGSPNPDGTFSIPGMPGGYYWLQLSATGNSYWTSSSNFDAGVDIVGNPSKLITPAPTPTTLAVSLTGLDAQQIVFLSIQSNDRSLNLRLPYPGTPAATSLDATVHLIPNFDYSDVNTLFVTEHEQITSGAFSGFVLGPALTVSNFTITSGAANSLTGILIPSPQASIPLNIQGSAWAANYQSVAPATPTPLLTDFSVSAQPFVTNRLAIPLITTFGPNLTMMGPRGSTLLGFPFPAPNACEQTSGPVFQGSGLFTLPIILTDQDFGTISYGDPYPAPWPRIFQICQHATVQIPRPNSTQTDTFLLTFGQRTTLPTGAIAPLVGPVQNPMINGSTLFQPAALNSTAVNLSWTAPAGSKPYGYFVTVFQLATLSSGITEYVGVARFGTAKTSLDVPLLNAASTYIFQITAWVDGVANMETSPARSQLPVAHSTVISAPITIN
jgi:hypothetical protein